MPAGIPVAESPVEPLVMQLRAGNVLLISPYTADHEFLKSLFLKNGWRISGANSLESARRLMHKALVIVTEADLNPGSWKDVLALADGLPCPPLVIVTSTHADEYLWVEALNLGAHDVIAKPFDTVELTRVLSTAWMKWEHSEVRRKGIGASDREFVVRSGNHG